ncbi:hypothetical protein [Paraburkholderia lycopersici]|uniref:Uncharacterized protein n=1 Tax=Paraburkholderia lycopersici TaxID=416944 RepID=A0A1G6K3W0_9BURK|nr:hypothetical protein [Paraburkholderia lycopersici]SDC25680.1 hypothetical protein SAMN05421548_10590 [Paraburkholderia lycopersici]
MGAEGPRSFSEIIAAKRAEFISYREAVTKLAEYCGDSLAAVAEGLKQHDIQMLNGAFLEGSERSVVLVHSCTALNGLLDETIKTGEIPDSVSFWDEPNATADGDGWIRKRFIELLRAVDLPCPESLETPGMAEAIGVVKPPAEVAAARWATALRGMSSFHLWEAASVLAGIDPYEPDWGTAPEEDAEIRRCKRLLVSAIDAGELPNNTWGSTRDEQEIPHASLRAWCRENGYDWPIPQRGSLATIGVEDPAEIDRLRAVEMESVELRRHLDAAIASLADANARLAKLDPSTDVLAEMRALQDEINRLKGLAPPRPEFLIPIVVAVQKQFWADWDESKPRPKAEEEIQPWIRSNFPQISDSNALVQAVEKVACPFNRNPAAKK